MKSSQYSTKKEMLREFNDGRSKSCYCIAANVFEISELQDALTKTKKQIKDLQPKEKAKVMHSILEFISDKKGYILKLRK